MRFATMSTTKCLRMLAQMSIERRIGRVFKITIFLGALHGHPNVLDRIEGRILRSLNLRSIADNFDLGDILGTIYAGLQWMFIVKMNPLLGPIQSWRQVPTKLALKVSRNWFFAILSSLDFEAVILVMFGFKVSLDVIDAPNDIIAKVANKITSSGGQVER